jgi:hypothetical protein
MPRRIYPTRFGQMHLRSNEGKGVPLVLLHMSPRSGAMWELLQEKLERPTHAPDRLGYGFPTRRLGPCRWSSMRRARSTRCRRPESRRSRHFGHSHGFHRSHRIAHIRWLAGAAGDRRRHAAVFGEEQQRQLEKYSEQPLRPATEGGHVLGAWRGGFAFRQPPYDLADIQRRFVEHVLAANPGAAFRAACGYPIEKKLKSLKAPLTVFAPHDDIIEQTQRVKPLLKPAPPMSTCRS